MKAIRCGWFVDIEKCQVLQNVVILIKEKKIVQVRTRYARLFNDEGYIKNIQEIENQARILEE